MSKRNEKVMHVKLAGSRFQEIYEIANDNHGSVDVEQLNKALRQIRTIANGAFTGRTKYEQKIYDLLGTSREAEFEMEDLKKKLDCVHYENFAHFKRQVLDKLNTENFSWKVTQKIRRKVTHILIEYKD